MKDNDKMGGEVVTVAHSVVNMMGWMAPAVIGLVQCPPIGRPNY